MSNKVATVVVIGDIGRSPRMQYHCCSLLKNGYNVNIVGYLESPTISDISNNSKASIINLKPSPIKNYFIKTFWIFITLCISLFRLVVVNKSHVMIFQNPPAIPGILVAYLMCLIGRCTLIIDWHNYTHSILALNSNPNAILVRISKSLECLIGRLSHANLCVTKAMKQDLKEKYNIQAEVLYDRPPKQFKSITIKEKHELIMKLAITYPELKTGNQSTLFTEEKDAGVVVNKKDRAAILISSTSWTPDEDFSILLAALESMTLLTVIF